jgi:tetratricopeptide (TPR) repeat protein
MTGTSRTLLPALLALFACAGGPHTIRVEAEPLAPGVAEAIRRAGDQRDAGREDDSLRVVEELLARDPWLVPAHRLRQDLLRERGREGRLYHDYLRMTQQHPGRPEAWYLLGRMETRQARMAEQFERALEVAPHDFWGQFGKAWLLRKRGELRDAAERYEACLRARPEEPLCYLGLGETLRLMHNYKDAEQTYLAFRKAMPEDGRADIGLVRTYLEGQRRDVLLGALVRAVQKRPGDETVVDLVGQFLELMAAPPERERLLHLLESRHVREAFLGAGGGALLAELAVDRGDLSGARRYLESSQPDGGGRPPDDVAWFRLWRRIRMGEGAVQDVLAEWEKRLPRSLLDDAANTVRPRLLRLLEGTWRTDPEPLATPEKAHLLLAALRDAGWLDEARSLAHRAMVRWPEDHRIAALADEVMRQLQFEAAMRRVLYAGYRQNRASLSDLVEELRAQSRETLGVDVVGEPRILSFAFIGEVLDPQGPGLPAHLARYNRYLVLGQRNGRAPEGLMLTRLSQKALPPDADVPVPEGCLEVIGEHRLVRSLSGVQGGDLAGAAIFHHYFIDLDAVRRWANDIIERRRRLAPYREEAIADLVPPGAPTEVDRPARVHERLELVAPQPDDELLDVVLDMVRWHERAHLVDSFRYLPMLSHLGSALGLLLSHGFSADSIEAEMELRAERASLAKSRAPLLVLAHIAGFLQDEPETGPHALGFQRLAEQIVGRMATEATGDRIDRMTNLVAQWHRLTEAQARAIGMALLHE